MKYEIIFKSGKIKNIVSKDANKIKNYITESFNNIKSYKKLDEANENDINLLSEEEQIKLVEKNPERIKYIKNPSEAVQLMAIKEDAYAIQYIKNPSEAVQLAAVKTGYPGAISYIKNPSEAVQLAAVRVNGWAIKYIKDPSEAVQLAAVKNYGWVIQDIKDPSEAVQLAAVKSTPDVIKDIKNPSEEMKKIYNIWLKKQEESERKQEEKWKREEEKEKTKFISRFSNKDIITLSDLHNDYLVSTFENYLADDLEYDEKTAKHVAYKKPVSEFTLEERKTLKDSLGLSFDMFEEDVKNGYKGPKSIFNFIEDYKNASIVAGEKISIDSLYNDYRKLLDDYYDF